MAKRKKPEFKEAGSPWLATFADLMNLLLCFFVVLFASSNVDAAKYAEIAESFSNSIGHFGGTNSLVGDGNRISTGIKQVDNLEQYYNEEEKLDEDISNQILEYNKKATMIIFDDISGLSDQNDLENIVEISIDPNFRYLKLSLSGSILFDSGKAEIKSEALPIFDKLGEVLRNYKSNHIEIEGHTDNVPMNSSLYPNNNWLSSARALNSATYLIDKKGMDPNNLSWTGRGEYDPVASNSTNEGRAKNRRVEIKIYNNISN